MKSLAVLLMVVAWTVCLVSTINVIHTWIQSLFERKGTPAGPWLMDVMRTVRRVK